MYRACNEFLKRWIDVRRKHQYLVSKTLNGQSKKSVNRLKVLLNQMKKITKCHELQL